jgi:hypothetical protein
MAFHLHSNLMGYILVCFRMPVNTQQPPTGPASPFKDADSSYSISRAPL